jgi:hypothetical protein
VCRAETPAWRPTPGGRTLFKVAVESLCQVANNAEAASLVDLSRRGATILHLASHKRAGLVEFDANASFSARKCVTRGVCDKFIYNHSQTPTLF